MVQRIVAIVFIYICTVLAWVSLGSTIIHRTNAQDDHLRHQVGQLWGTVQKQSAPNVYYQTQKTRTVEKARGAETITETLVESINHQVPLESSDIKVDLSLEYRRKGLLYYSTYRAKFKAKYKIMNPTDLTRDILVSFRFPSQGSVYENFKFLVGGKEIPDISLDAGQLVRKVRLDPNHTEFVDVQYETCGMDEWWYGFGSEVRQVKDFSLTMNTDFKDIDFPQNSISPTKKKTTANGWQLEWKYTNLLTGVEIAMAMPHKLNPGPWVGQVSFAAPISLFLFFFLLFVFTTIRGVRIHPMSYFFIGAAFFSFHLLLAYLVDHVSIHLAFLLSSLVSIFLVISYMRLVVGSRFAFLEIGLSQFVYLVLFSYTFFFKGYTGLAITILCIVTLFVVMQVTARVDWGTVFNNKGELKPKTPKEDFIISS